MLFLVKDILDFSQLEANSLILNFNPCNVYSLLEDCVNLLKFKADEKGIQLTVASSSQSVYWPRTLFTDANRLKQIVINLVSNAIKYTMDGFVRIYSEVD
jgi:signal transduction histidine kinase